MRELQAQAAEKRMQENEKRGVKNVESVKRQQERKNQMENMEDNRIGSGSNNLRVQKSKSVKYHIYLTNFMF